MYSAKREFTVDSHPLTMPRQDARPAVHSTGATAARESIYLIARQERDRCALAEMFIPFRARFRSFGSIAAYLEHGRTDEPTCLIVDLESDAQRGEDLPARLGGQASPPVILLSDQADVSATVRAMKSGVLEFLLKPVNVAALHEAVAAALTVDEKRSVRRAELMHLQACYSLLTPRERQVLPLIVAGLLNKQAAAVLCISEVTLQIHRSQIMRKMQASCFADLIRMALKLRIPHSRPEAYMAQIATEREHLCTASNVRNLFSCGVVATAVA